MRVRNDRMEAVAVVTGAYTFDETIPPYVRNIVELRQPRDMFCTSDSEWVYRLDIDANDHVKLVTKTVLW